jgi:hypothetical protein
MDLMKENLRKSVCTVTFSKKRSEGWFNISNVQYLTQLYISWYNLSPTISLNSNGTTTHFVFMARRKKFSQLKSLVFLNDTSFHENLTHNIGPSVSS